MRFDIDRYREIAETLTRNKSRSFLTGFGVFWGIFMLLVLVGGGNGLKELLWSNFSGFATNSAILFPNTTTEPYKGFKENRAWSLTLSDVDRMKREIPEADVITPMVSSWGAHAERGEFYSDGSVKGVRADYAKVEEPKLKYGRFINDADLLQDRKVCVIGKEVYTKLFPEGGDPCGQYIKLGAMFLQVVGVDANSSNMSINGSSQRAIVVPMTILQKVFNRGENVDLICMTMKPGYKVKDVAEKARQSLYRAHSIHPDDKQAMHLLNTEEMFSLVDNLFRGVNFLIWLVGLGTLLAGAIGVSNIMMVTVKERTTEIGIRRAIGATPKVILSQIIAESITLTFSAGLIGIVFTVFVLNMLELGMTKDGVLQAHFQINFWVAIIAAVLLSVLGALAGLAPAMRAMNIKPVDAMRDE